VLLEKINKEELDFLECWFNPICLAECLFSNFDRLSEFKEDTFGEIRLYQFPMMSYEAIIDEEIPGVDKETRFALRKGAGDCFSIGARKYGKCEYEYNLCSLTNGQTVFFKDLINKQAYVWTLNEKTKKLEKQKAYFYNNGVKSCYEVQTKSGKKIIITENHPLLTQEGWKQAKDIQNNDFIATVRQYNFDERELIDVDENIAKLLGYLIGDGSCSQGAIGFTNINSELIEEFKSLVANFRCQIRQKGITYFIKWNNRIKKEYVKGKGYNLYDKRTNPIKQLVDEYELNTLSKNKEFSNKILRWKNKYIAILLNRLFACDGTINVNNYSIELCLASKKLVYQIQHLLLRFGIHSNVYKKEIKLNNQIFRAWRLIVAKDFDKFLDIIGIKSKDNGIRRNKNYSTSDIIPNKFIRDFYPKFTHKKELRLRSLITYNPTREKCLTLNKKIKSSEFQTLIDSDIYWEKIKNIKKIKKLKTVAVSVPYNNTYISNDIISHNTLITEKIDVPLSMLYDDGWWVGFSAPDGIHLKDVLDVIKTAIQHHPILSMWKRRISRAPKYEFEAKNYWKLDGINMNVKSKEPGSKFFGKHVQKLWIEECSLETEQVATNRRDSLSELGGVLRFSGMTNFTKHSPAGKTFYNPKNKNKIVNYPQFVNPNWSENDKIERLEEFGGEDTPNYRIFVKGEVIEDGISAFDMERIKECFQPKKQIKKFEIKKDKFKYFKSLIVVERPQNAERIFVCADIGESAGTEIIILSEIGDKYNYLYNIALYNLKREEQEKIFKWIIEKVEANVIAIDCGDAMGRNLADDFEKAYSKDNVVRYAGASKVKVGFEKNEQGKVKVDNKGKPVFREEFMSEWSVERLKTLLYGTRVNIPVDYKFEKQFSEVISTKSGTRTIYDCISMAGNHLFEAWKTFGIAQWVKKDFNQTKPIKKDWGLGTDF